MTLYEAFDHIEANYELAWHSYHKKKLTQKELREIYYFDACGPSILYSQPQNSLDQILEGFLRISMLHEGISVSLS